MCQFTDSFYSAVRTLAGDGHVKQRLLLAYTDNLDTLPDGEVPDSIRSRFAMLREAMHAARPLGNESPMVASVRKMSAADASSHAASIVAMFSELVRVKATGERLRVVSSNDADEADDIAVRAALN